MEGECAMREYGLTELMVMVAPPGKQLCEPGVWNITYYYADRNCQTQRVTDMERSFRGTTLTPRHHLDTSKLAFSLFPPLLVFLQL